MPWIVLSVLACVLVLVLVAAIRWEAGRRESRRDAWRSFASSRGLDWSEAAGPWYRRTSDGIEGSVEGVPVRLDLYSVHTGHAQVNYTRVQSRLERPLPAKLAVAPRNFFNGIAERLGWNRIRTSDPSFDARASVRSALPEVARRAIDEDVRARWRELERCAWMQVDGSALKIWWRGTETSPQVLDAGLRLAAALHRACAKA